MIFTAILRTQWRWGRSVVLPGAVLLAIVPYLVVRDITPRMMPVEAMLVVTGWSPVFPALAGLLGLLAALVNWAPDRRGQHVHALTLPIPRPRYVLYRYLGGTLLLALPLIGLLIGALAATGFVSLPSGLQSYPWALVVRFTLATLLAYSLFFAILAGTARTAAMVLGALGLMVGAGMLMAFVAPDGGIGTDLFYLLFHGPGPFALFAARWMLIDV